MSARWLGGCAAAVVFAATAAAATGCDLGGLTQGSGGHHDDAARTMTFALAGFPSLRTRVPVKPVATTGTSFHGVGFELYSVRRSGKVATVVFALRNTGGAAIDMSPVAQSLDENHVVDGTFVASNVAVVDTRGLKEYRSFVAADDADVCLCSVVNATNPAQARFRPAERRYFATQVAAPPPGVTEVSVHTGLAAVGGVRIEG